MAYLSDVVIMFLCFGSRDVGWHVVKMQLELSKITKTGYVWVVVANRSAKAFTISSLLAVSISSYSYWHLASEPPC